LIAHTTPTAKSPATWRLHACRAPTHAVCAIEVCFACSTYISLHPCCLALAVHACSLLSRPCSLSSSTKSQTTTARQSRDAFTTACTRLLILRSGPRWMLSVLRVCGTAQCSLWPGTTVAHSSMAFLFPDRPTYVKQRASLAELSLIVPPVCLYLPLYARMLQMFTTVLALTAPHYLTCFHTQSIPLAAHCLTLDPPHPPIPLLILLRALQRCVDRGAQFPLRGHKYSFFEGGCRVATFVASPLLPSAVRGTTYAGLVGVFDWYATFAGLAGVDVVDPDTDSVDLWPCITSAHGGQLQTRFKPCRQELLIGVGGAQRAGAYRNGSLKLIMPGGNDASADGWSAQYPGSSPVVKASDVPAAARCGIGASEPPCMFDVETDPQERNNLAVTEPLLLARMQARYGCVSRGCAFCDDINC
jgi:hypothetical protein